MLIGYSTEKTFRFFVDYAREQGTDFEILDLSIMRSCVRLIIEESEDELIIDIDGRPCAFGKHRTFFHRSYWTNLGHAGRNAALSQLTMAISAFLQRHGGTVINRPAAGLSNINKFTHTTVLEGHGFQVPETWIFGKGERARATLSADEGWISKSCSSSKTRAAVLDAPLFSRLDRLAVCPSLFQKRIRGADVRVHTVGESLFAERIDSSRVDYRFADDSVAPNRYSICDVPDQVARACRDYCRAEALAFAGIDFKISEDDGDWIALEVNQMPGYESYDRRQGRRISRALLNLLTDGESFTTVAS